MISDETKEYIFKMFEERNESENSRYREEFDNFFKEKSFISVVWKMQNYLQDSEKEFVELNLMTDTHLIRKEDNVTQTKEGFLSINNHHMYNLKLIHGASIVEVLEEEKREIGMNLVDEIVISSTIRKIKLLYKKREK